MTSYDDTKVQLTINRMTEECYDNLSGKSSTELYLISQDPTSIAKIDLDAQGAIESEISALSAQTIEMFSQIGNDISALSAWDTTQDSLISELSTQTISNSTDISALDIEIQEVSANMSKSIIRRWEHVEYNGLTFTAEQANSTIAMQKAGSAPDVSLEYSTGDGWHDFVVGETTVTLPNVGDECVIRAKTTNTGMGSSASDYNRFVMTGKIAASDSIMYLLKNDGDLDTISSKYCFCYLFQGCTSLTTAPDLPATTLASSCYNGMFWGCASLTTPPELPATTMADYCYNDLFKGCTSLTNAPALPATTLASHCYWAMFLGCTSLTTAPELPATTLAHSCYRNMFDGCTSLTTAPALPVTTLMNNCYQNMFRNCTSLTTAPELPATSLAWNCYEAMFYGCTSLTTAPELPATTLASSCYNGMFWGCTSLNSIKIGYTGNFSGQDVPSDAFTNWVNGVAASGTFYYDGEDTTTGNSAIPTGWTVIPFNLTFTARQANSTIAMNAVGSAPSISLEYSTDHGSTWNDFIVGSTTITLSNVGDKAHIRAKTPNAQLATSNDNRNSFSMTGQIEVSGNLAAILNKDVDQGKVLDSTLTYHLCGLFQDCTSLVGSAKGLVIPFETLYGDSFNSLFRNTRITIAPDLPCMNIGIGSYSSTFIDCTSLTTAPELPATTIADYAYYLMFQNCTALTTPPSVLPATSPCRDCYRQMFIGCTSLTRTPDIKMQNIWTTTRNAMWDMFKNCTSLETATVNRMTLVNGSLGMAYTFIGCTSLKNVGLKSLSGVYNSNGLQQMLDGCSALEVVDFSEATSVPNLYNASTFQNTNSTFKIVVPDALYDQWIAAGNWRNFASQIVKASEYVPAA